MGSDDLIAQLKDELSRATAEIAELKARNARVDSNKAWETSWTRLVSIVALLYVTMIFLFYTLGSQQILIDALIPTTGYLLSSFSMPFIRKYWENCR